MFDNKENIKNCGSILSQIYWLGDVVIVDEASQADAMALTTLYLGSQVVIVGDHEQVSPVGVGQNQDEIQKLIDEHLPGIPNSQLYDGLFSIYNLGMTTFDSICLREH